jgi:hypothetical protein
VRVVTLLPTPVVGFLVPVLVGTDPPLVGTLSMYCWAAGGADGLVVVGVVLVGSVVVGVVVVGVVVEVGVVVLVGVLVVGVVVVVVARSSANPAGAQTSSASTARIDAANERERSLHGPAIELTISVFALAPKEAADGQEQNLEVEP